MTMSEIRAAIAKRMTREKLINYALDCLPYGSVAVLTILIMLLGRR